MPTDDGFGPAAFAAILSVEGQEERHIVGGRLQSSGSHNVAENTGLLKGLEHALALGVTDLTVYGDSRLVIEQVAGRWKVKAGHLIELRAHAQELAGRFERVHFEWVPRARNAEADRLVNSVLDGEELPVLATSPSNSKDLGVAARGRDERLKAIAASLDELARQVRELADEASESPNLF